MWMTLNQLKTNSAKFAHYRPKIQKVIEVFEFWSLKQHPLYQVKKNKQLMNTMLLLTNCEVHTRKYSDRSLDVRKTKVRIFSSMDRTNWSIRALLYSRNQY